MEKLAVVVSKSHTGDVYIISAEDVGKFTSHSYEFCGYAESEEEACRIADRYC